MHSSEQSVAQDSTQAQAGKQRSSHASRLLLLLRRLAGARPGTVCIGGYAGCGNIGDDAILQGFLARVTSEGMPRVVRRGADAFPQDSYRTACHSSGSKPLSGNASTEQQSSSACACTDPPHGPNLLRRFTVLSGAPKRDARRFGVRCVNRKNPVSLLLAFLRSEYFLCGGGSLLQNATGHLSLCYYLGLLRMARLCGCRTALLSAGIGPLHGELAQQAVARELNHCVQVNLRDHDSLRSLSALGVRRELLSLSPDPAFFMPTPPPSRLPFLLREAGIPLHTGYFCVALHAPCGSSPDLMRVIKASLRHIAEAHSLLPVFLLFDTKADGYPSARISEAVGGRVLHLREASDAVAVISGARFLFSMRLHALIFSVIACTPALALSVSAYETKLASFARSAGIPHLHSPSIVTLVDELERLMTNRDKIRAVLPDVLEELSSVR